MTPVYQPVLLCVIRSKKPTTTDKWGPKNPLLPMNYDNDNGYFKPKKSISNRPFYVQSILMY